MLDAALSNRLSGGVHAPLLVLSDTLLQPSLLLTRELIHSALSPSSSPSPSSSFAPPQKGQRVLVICTAQPPHKLLPPSSSYDPSLVSVLDCTLSSSYPPLASSSTASAPAWTSLPPLDLSAPRACKTFEQRAVEAVEQLAKEEGGVLVVLDSANAVAEEAEEGVSGVVRLVKRLLSAVKGRKGSRVLVIHHDDLPPPPPSFASSSSHAIQPSLLSSLLSPALSPSNLYLTLRPSAYVELLSREYGLSIPRPSSSPSGADEENSEPDLRLGLFLASLAQRAQGDPLVKPHKAEDEDERVPLDALGGSFSSLSRESGQAGRPNHAAFGSRGGCVLEWAARGVEVLLPLGAGAAALAREKQLEREQERERAAKGEVKKVVKWGFEGVRVEVNGESGRRRVREAGLGEVVDWGRMGRRGAQLSPSPLPTPPTQPASSSTPSSAASHAQQPPTQQQLPFSLTLTPSQLAARSLVSNPFHGNDAPIFGEAGYVAPVLPGTAAGQAAGGGGGAGGGTVDYTPDQGDDWDDEDPDEDLEI
ncbi:hypothetical protein JCM8547_002567 [Rhodosporidiobolus lusitaniae]